MTPGYLLMPGRHPLARCKVCGVEVAIPHTHVCVEPERGALADGPPREVAEA